METKTYDAEMAKVLDEMTQSVSTAREVIKELITRNEQSSELDTKDGISLLSMKCHLMLSYLHSLTLLGAHRVLGHSLKKREPPTANFSDPNRQMRGANAGDLVDALVQDRLVLEKIKGMEGRMKYQIDKLLRMADEEAKTGTVREDDPLAFRPNPGNFAEEAGSMSEASAEEDEGTGVYKPPRVAPVPYVETRTKDKSRKAPVPAALSSLQHMDSSAPYVEKTSGLGAPSTVASSRARELQRMTEFEEENMMRLVMNKKESKRRKRDEADIALGGSGVGGRGRQRGGLEDEFRDILHSVGKSRSGPTGDGYEELRQQGKRKAMFERAKGRNTETADGDGNPRKKARFEQEVRRSKKKLQTRRS